MAKADFRVSAARAVGDSQLRKNFRRAMDGLMEKRAAQFSDGDELERLRKLGESIRSRSLAKLPELLVQLEHGESEIDNNLIENAIRPSAVGKKNFLFIGSPEAGQRSAVIYSIIVSCERHGIDPLAYMTDVLEKLPSMSNQDDYSPLLPSNWKEPR